MNNKVKILSVLTVASLLTGCGAFNNTNAAAPSSETPAQVTEAPAEEAASEEATAEDAAESTEDCCKDKEKDCCKDEPADCCGDSAEVVLGKPEKESISIGYLNSTAHLLAFVAQEEGYFKEEGLKVTLTQFSSAAELVNGL